MKPKNERLKLFWEEINQELIRLLTKHQVAGSVNGETGYNFYEALLKEVQKAVRLCKKTKKPVTDPLNNVLNDDTTTNEANK